MSKMANIWKGDKLKRRDEARLLERFLNTETEVLRELGREQAYVLAIDAQYGEGKTWFLDRLRQQLEINHPVAFVDAWVDDANSEPLVSIMAAIDNALQPFLASPTVKERLEALTRAAFPIVGKAAIGAGGKLFGRFLGDTFGDEAKAALETASKKTDRPKGSSAVETGVDKLAEGVAAVVDNAGKAMLEQYRARQKSRETFKHNLRLLAASIERSHTDPRHSPIYVIVDELDRCRPDYAVSLLESIKHLFDVPGVVFIIALHGSQLTASIEAVYGAKFDATAYLRRFFTRHYELRRLSIEELVASLFDLIKFQEGTFSYPQLYVGGVIKTVRPAAMVGMLLSEWRVTPREAQSIIDGLRLFVANWDLDRTPIELPLVLVLLTHLVRGIPLSYTFQTNPKPEITFAGGGDPLSSGRPSKQTSSDLLNVYGHASNNYLAQIVRNNDHSGMYSHVTRVLGDEYQIRFGSSHVMGEAGPLPSWSEYIDRVKEIGRFVDTNPGDDEQLSAVNELWPH